MVLIMESSSTNVAFLVVGCFLCWDEGEESADGVSLPTPKALSVLVVRVKQLLSLPLPLHVTLCPVGTGLNGVRVRIQYAPNRFFQILHMWRV